MEARINATEASKMLEAALQQMDGIIATSATTNVNNSIAVDISIDDGIGGSGGSDGTSTDMQTGSSITTTAGSGSHSLSEHNYVSANNVLSTANTLALALQQVSLIGPPPDPVTATIISNWLDTHVPRQDSDERLRRLQRDKENLALQYQLLADKVDEQSNKIIELEGLLAERTQQLSAKEELLHRQICTRSELETQKLELMNALSELKLHRAALERENLNLKNLENLAQSTQKSTVSAPITTTTMSTASVNPLQTYGGSMGNLNVLIENSSTPKAAAAASASTKYQRPMAAYFHSLPRIQISRNNKSKLPWIHLNTSSNSNNMSLDNNVSNKQRNVVFALHEKVLIDDNDDDGIDNSSSAHSLPYQYNQPQQQEHQQQQQELHDVLHGLKTMGSPNLKERSTKSLRNILGKLKRSNSGHLESLPDSTVYNNDCSGEFRRGDRARSTAGGRIEYSRSITPQSTTDTAIKNWSDWSIQELCNWLCDLGLHCYVDDCRKWLTQTASIKTFFSATSEELEKQLNIKWPLHRKKLVLARDDLMGIVEDKLALQAGQLDVNWVLRWLDDIGLPQYKDTFVLNKVDGRVLHRLTMEDLLQLQVTSYLHIASLRRAIQCMREIHWQPECLIRRSMNVTSSSNPSTRSEVEEMSSDVSSSLEECSDTVPALIPLWTAHRVMEWLRVLDLSEYAPNLRGAGVHGALMIYEPRFNANLLADLLSIPPSKTLLRRHLATHFKELLGRDIIQSKRDAETDPNYQPLSITAKLKPPKKSQFTLKRRKNSKHLWINFNHSGDELDWHDYVCPVLNASTPISTSSSNSLNINNSITNNNNNNNSNNNNNNNNNNNCNSNNNSNIIKT